MKIRNDLLIRILETLADFPDWSKGPKIFSDLVAQGKEKCLLAHVNYLIQMGHIEERKNRDLAREWSITPSGRDYLEELSKPEAGF